MKKTIMILITLFLAVAVIGIGFLAVQYYTSDSYMELKGDKEVNIGLYGVYDEQGVEAMLHGRDASDQVKITGKVDTSKAGTYKLNYQAGNFKLSRKIVVGDTMNPVIDLEGDDSVTIKLGDKYTDPGYTAKDDNGNDLTDKVKVSEANLKKAGKQEVEYTVSDSEGNTTRLTRTVTVEPNTSYSTSGLPICMYHYVYDENDPPADVNANYISVQDLSEELEWLNEQGYYYPTWQEVRDYIDGKLMLPEKSIVLTFDDGAYSFLDNGIPVLEKYKTPATSFVITANDGKKKMAKYHSDYVTFQSHSDSMHRGGGNIGHGGIFTVMPHDDAVADLKKSVEIVGNGEAFAYPFGDVNDATEQAVKDAGFLCAVTTVQGRVKPGDNPYLLNRQRMSNHQSMEAFRAMVMPF